MTSILIKTLAGDLLPLSVPNSRYIRTFLCDAKALLCKFYPDYIPEMTTVFRIEEDEKVPIAEGEVFGVVVESPVYTHESLCSNKGTYKVDWKENVFYVAYKVSNSDVVTFKICRSEASPLTFITTELWLELSRELDSKPVCSVIKNDIYKMIQERYPEKKLHLKESMAEAVRCRCGYTNTRGVIVKHLGSCNANKVFKRHL